MAVSCEVFHQCVGASESTDFDFVVVATEDVFGFDAPVSDSEAFQLGKHDDKRIENIPHFLRSIIFLVCFIGGESCVNFLLDILYSVVQLYYWDHQSD